jgi:hypothetical protein
MFDPIKAPPDQYSGPATGLSTEKGDSWHAAVTKINAGFKNIIKAIEGGVASAVHEVGEWASHDEVADLRAEVAELKAKLEAFMAAPAVANTGDGAVLGGDPQAATAADAPPTPTVDIGTGS